MAYAGGLFALVLAGGWPRIVSGALWEIWDRLVSSSVTGRSRVSGRINPLKRAMTIRVKMRQCGRVQAKILHDLGGAAISCLVQRSTCSFKRNDRCWGVLCPRMRLGNGVSGGDNLGSSGWHQPGPVSGLMISQEVGINFRTG
jgi:hypothetical protein